MFTTPPRRSAPDPRPTPGAICRCRYGRASSRSPSRPATRSPTPAARCPSRPGFALTAVDMDNELQLLTLRFGFPDDAAALDRLAALDSSEPPASPVLLGEVGGHLRAALSLADGSVVADPFHPTVALVELLHARARQLTTVRSVPRRPLRSIGAAFRARLRLQSHR